MEILMLLATAIVLWCFVLPVVSLPTVSAIGAKFFDSDGNQFFIKGVIYSLSMTGIFDPLIDTAQCTRDATLMKILGANTIRVYTVDATADHTGCMSAFESAGIYLLVALDSPTASINRANPSWTTELYNNYTAVIDAFSSFDNTLGFFAGNEVVIDLDTTVVAPYVKAAALDLKKYRDRMGYRQIPIGYSAADLAGVRPMLQDYLACGSEGIDFFGQHVYSWCGESTMSASGYDQIYADASGYSIPILFSETGCNFVQPRTFGDQAAIYGTAMNDRWSGAIIYEWLDHPSNYGLVTYSPSGATSGTPTPISQEFSNLQSRWSTLTPTGTPVISYDASVTVPSCPSSTSGWSINGNVALPTLNKLVVNTRSTSSATRSSTGTPTGLPKLNAKTSSTTSVSTSTSARASDTSAVQHEASQSSGGLSTGAKAGIAIGVVFFILIAGGIAFLIWRRRQKRQPLAPLDLTPEGLEVGSPPAKHELDGTVLEVPISENQMKSELPDTHSVAFSNGTTQNNSPVLNPSTTIPSEMGHSPDSISSGTPELSNIPPTPKSLASSPSQIPVPPVTRRPVPIVPTSASWANAPWETEAFPFSQEEVSKAQTAPLLSGTDEEDEIKRLDEEERRLDAQIAESERIRALKEEKAALQAKRAELIEAREKSSKT